MESISKLVMGAGMVAVLGLGGCANYESLDSRVSKLEAQHASMHRKMEHKYKHKGAVSHKHEMGVK